MKPNAALGGMGRRAASLVVLFGVMAVPALAGDRALIDFIGYSPDARYFAFEEYGVQDGSGFPYATIFVVDLAADKWAPGSPYRARLDNEDATVAAARMAAQELAAAKLTALDVSIPADLVALNGDGETGDDGHRLEFGRPGFGTDAPRDVRSLTLETFPANSPTPCESYVGEKGLGYALVLEGEELHRDTALPQSRGCPLDYRIYGVVMPADWSGAEAAVAIIASYPFGFEGPDRRFLAVPLDR
jgi:predicted secreted protein